MNTTTRRTWTPVGERFTPARPVIERAIATLTWLPASSDLPMMPALGIRACIQELPLPRVSRVAVDGAFDFPDTPDGTAHYSIYGIEANYSDGRAHVFIADLGSELVPLCSDFFPAGSDEAFEAATGDGRR